MALKYAELNYQRDQERAAIPTWRSPQSLGLPSRTPLAPRRRPVRAKVNASTATETPTGSMKAEQVTAA